MDSCPIQVVFELVANNYCSCISPRCWAKFELCKTLNVTPCMGTRLTCTAGIINLKALNAISTLHNTYDVIIILSNELKELFTLDLSDPQTLVTSLINCSIIERSVLQMLHSKGISCKLLKDALLEPALSEFIPDVLIDICRYIFLPSGINLRNLLWHGFLIPEELGDFAFFLSIIACLRRTFEDVLSRYCISPKSYPSLARSSYMDFWGEATVLVNSGRAESLLQDSLMVLPGRAPILRSAFHDFSEERYISFLLKVIPSLEHGLRLIFCLVNNLPQYLLAEEGHYYSTLDGFGQKSKHQLLLHPLLHVNSAPSDDLSPRGGAENLLPGSLGRGEYALLLDLFFTEAGYNLRGKFAHGEIDMTGDLRRSVPHTEDVYLKEMSSSLVVLFVMLCDKFHRAGDKARRIIETFASAYSPAYSYSVEADAAMRPCEEIDVLNMSRVHDWDSCFHPHRLLGRDMAAAAESLLGLSNCVQTRQYFRVSGVRGSCGGSSECELRFEVVVGASGPHVHSPVEPESEREGDFTVVGVWEKRNRIVSMISHNELVSVQQESILDGGVYGADVSCSGVSFLTKSIVGNCLLYLRTLYHAALNTPSLPQGTHVILHNIIRSMNYTIRRHLQQDDDMSGDGVIKSCGHCVDEFTQVLQEFLDSNMHIYAPSLLTGVACCSQLCKVLTFWWFTNTLAFTFSTNTTF